MSCKILGHLERIAPHSHQRSDWSSAHNSMAHNHAGGTGSTSMGDGVPDLFHMQRMYWAVLGAAIAFATSVNVLNKLLALQRYHRNPLPPCSCWLMAWKIQLASSETEVHFLGILRDSDSYRARAYLCFIGHVSVGKLVCSLSNLRQDHSRSF